MFKKLFSILISLLIVLSGQSLVLVSAASDIGRVYCDADFEKANSIEFNAKSNSIIIDTETVDGKENSFVKVTKTTTDDAYFQASLPSSPKKLVIEQRIKVFELYTGFQPVTIRYDKYVASKTHAFVSVDKSSKVSAGGTQCGTLVSGQWNKLSVAFDFVNKVYSVWLNGNLAAQNVSFDFPEGTTLSSLRSNVGTKNYTSKTEWGTDDIRIYEASAPVSDEEFANIWYMLDRKHGYEDDEETKSQLDSTFALHKKNGFVYSSYIANPSKSKPKRLIYTEDDVAYVSATEVAKALSKTYNASLSAFIMDGNISFAVDSKTVKKGSTSYTLDYPSKVSGGVFYIHLESFAKKVLGKKVYSDDDIIVVSNSDFKGSSDASFLKTVKSFLSFLRPSREKIEQDFKASGSWGVHPRLMVKSADIERIKGYINSGDAFANRGLAYISATAARYVSDPLPEYVLDDRNTMLGIARDVLDKSEILGMSYLLTGNESHAARLYEVLLAACSFPDWNHHNHYLDTGEMSAGVALGFDFIYNYLTPEQRQPIINAIKEFSIYPGRSSHYAGGLKYSNNWNSVVNGGIAMAALAIADEDETYAPYAFDTVEKCIRGVEYLMPCFVPDGAWEESSGYWNLAMRYCMRMFGTFECSLGSNYYLTECEGFQNSGFFAAHVNGPYGLYNYHDSGFQTPDWDTFMWFSKSFGNYDYAALRHYNIAQFAKNPNCYDLMYYSPDYTSPDAVDRLELDKYFRNTELISLRSTWKNRQGLYIGAHGGLGKTAHWNLDSGTFVLDAMGTRFAEDLGAGNYSWDGFVNNKSYLYYLKRTEGQNCVVLNPREYVNTWDMGQDLNAFSEVTEFVSNPDSSYAVIDLTDAYDEQGATHYTRKYSLIENRSVITIEDDMTLSGESNQIYWFMHTKANIEFLSENKLLLTRSGKQLLCEFIIEGVDSYVIEDVKAEPLPMSPHPEVQEGADYGRKISLNAQGTGDVKIKVVFTPKVSNTNKRVYFSEHAHILPGATTTENLDNNFFYNLRKSGDFFSYGAAETIYMKFDLSDVNMDIQKAILHFDYGLQNRQWYVLCYLVKNDNWIPYTLSWNDIYDTQSPKIKITSDISGTEKQYSVYQKGRYGPEYDKYVKFFASTSGSGPAATAPLEVDVTELVREEQLGDGTVTLAFMLYTNSNNAYDRPFKLKFIANSGPYLDISSSVPTNLLESGDVKFKVDGEEVQTLSDGTGVLSAEFAISKNIRLPDYGTMVMAVYEDERLVGIYKDKRNFSSSSTTTFTATTPESIKITDKTRASVFFWHEMESLYPMMQKASISADGRQ